MYMIAFLLSQALKLEEINKASRNILFFYFFGLNLLVLYQTKLHQQHINQALLYFKNGKVCNGFSIFATDLVLYYLWMQLIPAYFIQLSGYNITSGSTHIKKEACKRH